MIALILFGLPCRSVRRGSLKGQNYFPDMQELLTDCGTNASDITLRPSIGYILGENCGGERAVAACSLTWLPAERYDKDHVIPHAYINERVLHTFLH